MAVPAATAEAPLSDALPMAVPAATAEASTPNNATFERLFRSDPCAGRTVAHHSRTPTAAAPERNSRSSVVDDVEKRSGLIKALKMLEASGKRLVEKFVSLLFIGLFTLYSGSGAICQNLNESVLESR